VLLAGAASVSFTNVVLVGFQLPDPSSPAALAPNGLRSGEHVSFRDVRILVDSSTLQQHVKFFNGQQNKVKTYSVSSCCCSSSLELLQSIIIMLCML
jgi:hypothetical protein